MPFLIQHDFAFDPMYGHTLDQLLAVPAPGAPSDFDAFWQSCFAKALEIPLEISRREIPSPHPGFLLFEVEYSSWEGVRIGGWITLPSGLKSPKSAVVFGHGYGGREAPDFTKEFSNAVCIFPCARGFHRSAHPDIPCTAAEHVLHGIEKRETYVHLGCAVDFALGASVLLELYPESAQALFYYGGSFGGGIGALLLAMDKRFHRAYLDVPSFGNHPLRVTLPCEGSGKAVKNRVDRGDRALLDVLAYFDAATAATRIRIPVFVAAATFDPSVPPPGQFAVYNALSGPKELFLRQAAHFDLKGNEHDDAAIASRLGRWFSPRARF